MVENSQLMRAFVLTAMLLCLGGAASAQVEADVQRPDGTQFRVATRSAHDRFVAYEQEFERALGLPILSPA
jgi:hypothetical protein